MKRSIIYLSLALLILTPFNSILALETNYRYTGQELDQEINLYNYGARYYNPEIGRFNGPDPVLNDNSIDSFFLNNSNREELNKFLSGPQRLNAYSYTLNNPVKYVDPSGEDPMVWDYTTDVMFFNESLSDYNQNKSLGNALALGADALGLALPILPAGTGSLFKSFAKGVNTLVDMWKQSRALKRFSVSIDEIQSIVSKADNAYEAAKQGGSHTEWMDLYLDKSNGQLLESIKSFEKNIKSHIEKLRDPIKGTENKFYNFSEYYQKGLTQKWKKDLLRNQEQKNILEGIINNRDN